MSIPVDTARFTPIATGNFSPVTMWDEKPDGSRVRSDRQASTETGTPLWTVEILRTVESFGQTSMKPTQVTVPSMNAPTVVPLTPAKFEGLRVDFYASKGQIRERWEADGIRPSAPATTEK